MTAARIEKVYEDRVGARTFLAQADTILGDAGSKRRLIISTVTLRIYWNASMPRAHVVTKLLTLRHSSHRPVSKRPTRRLRSSSSSHADS
jgi:hypothetical protein